MTNTLSLYLDGLRFGAAFTVFLSHYAAGRISGGLFWQVSAYGRIAVLVFFVLSGFVIAWVTETRERSLEDFALSRSARLYSVIIPAFFITAALDYLGRAIDPKLYGLVWSHSGEHPILGFALSAVFLGQSWAVDTLPGLNVPYWSLNYEAWYYVLFGASMFLQGWHRIAALGIAALLAGSKILVLLPVWLMGVAAWRWRGAVPRCFGGPLAVGSLTAFIVFEVLGGRRLFPNPSSGWLPPDYTGYDFVIGMLIALFIVGLGNTPLPMPGPRIEQAIRWLAGASFGLYLLHFPLLNFFAAALPGPTDGSLHRILVFVTALGMALLLARLIEEQKAPLTRGLRLALHAIRRKRSRPALERHGL
jgi:peptidoglycan/LPS O-acetylase OafA/YrhL